MKTVNVKNPRTGGAVNIQKNAVGAIPPGAVLDFAGVTAPDGFFLCDGTAYDKNVYPELFAAIGYIYGGAADSFNVPALADKFIKGKGAESVGQSGGSNTNSHTHAVTSSVAISNHTSLALDSALGTITLNHIHAWYQAEPGGQGTSYTWNSSGNLQSLPYHSNSGLQIHLQPFFDNSTRLGNINESGYCYTSKSLADYNAAHAHTFSQNISAHGVTNNQVTSNTPSDTNNAPAYVVMNKIIKY